MAKSVKDMHCSCNSAFCKGKKTCDYAQIFESKNFDINKPLYRMKIINPYVVINSDNFSVDQGSNLIFKILLFGNNAQKNLNVISSIFKRSFQIGRFKHKGYGKIKLEKFIAEKKYFPQVLLKSKLKVATLSPLIIRKNNELLNSISLSDFAIACARKAHNMLLFHYDIDPKIDFNSLTKYRNVYPEFQEIKKFEIQKWSQKRLRKEKIEGIEGKFEYMLPDDIEFKKNLEKSLSIALITGIGSLTTHGFGRFELKSE